MRALYFAPFGGGDTMSDMPHELGFAQRVVKIWRDLRSSLSTSYRHKRFNSFPDRVALVNDVIPEFAGLGGEILWVGCRGYTESYYAMLAAKGARVTTMDHDPAVEKHGLKGRHVTGDICEADKLFRPAQFDGVLCNGIYGGGVETPEARDRMMKACAAILKPGGRFLLGWDNYRTDRADALRRASPYFVLEGFGRAAAEIVRPPSVHEMRLFRKISD